MNKDDDECYLIIESSDVERTSEFYKALGLNVIKGHPLGNYLVYTRFGYITINQSESTNVTSRQVYKPILALELTRKDIEMIIEKITVLGSRIIPLGEFLNAVGYECEDFSGGVVMLQIAIK